MDKRLDLQTLLESILGSDKVYFQPPSGYLMSYPCITYFRNDIHTRFADNLPFKLDKEYTVTVIDANPDSETPDKIAALPRCTFNRGFKSGNLNHDVFKLLY